MNHVSVLRDIVAFSIQIACVVPVVAILLKVVAIPARARYVCLRLALLACLVTPWLLRSIVLVTPPTTEDVGVAKVAIPVSASETGDAPQTRAMPAPVRALGNLPWPTLLLVALALGIIARAAWLIVGFKQLRWLNDRAVPVDAQEYADAQQQVGTSSA